MERKKELPSANKEGNEQSLTASGVVSFVESHQGVILAVLGGIVAVVALYFVLNQYVWGPREDAAKNEIFKAQQMFARDSFQVALDGNDEFMGFLDIINQLLCIFLSFFLNHFVLIIKTILPTVFFFHDSPFKFINLRIHNLNLVNKT